MNRTEKEGVVMIIVMIEYTKQVMHKVTIRWPMPSRFLSRSSPPSWFLPVFSFSMILHGMEHPFGQFGSAALVLSPPSSLYSLQHPCWQQKLKCPWLCVKTALQHLKWCVISTVLIKKKKNKNTAPYEPLWRTLTPFWPKPWCVIKLMHSPEMCLNVLTLILPL